MGNGSFEASLGAVRLIRKGAWLRPPSPHTRASPVWRLELKSTGVREVLLASGEFCSSLSESTSGQGVRLERKELCPLLPATPPKRTEVCPLLPLLPPYSSPGGKPRVPTGARASCRADGPPVAFRRREKLLPGPFHLAESARHAPGEYPGQGSEERKG
jgi:hypothetical protein